LCANIHPLSKTTAPPPVGGDRRARNDQALTWAAKPGSDRHGGMHGGAPAARADVQFAAKLLHSCAHSGDADAQAERPAALAAIRPVDPGVEAIAADEQMRLLADASQIDRDARCRCVAMHIGERLLHDATAGAGHPC
jgi:hypothetical protein